MHTHRLVSAALLSLFAWSAGCASASPGPSAEEPDAAQVESTLVKSCAGACDMDYTACFQGTNGDLCDCYVSYVSCMKWKCHSGPAFDAPECSTPDTGTPAPDTAAPDTAAPDTFDPCPVQCNCDFIGYPPAPKCTNTCAECKAACKRPNYQPCG